MKNSNKQSPRSSIRKTAKRKEKDKEYLEYQRYIRSKQFAEVKRLVKERDGCCQVCGRTEEDCEHTKIRFNVHHRSYAHLFEGGEVEANDCILLCSVCHLAIHRARSNMHRFRR